MYFNTEAEKELDASTKQVELLGVQLGLTLVALRQKLQPFIDEGVIYKDRKLVNKKRKK